jgi:hypothetical protein
VSNRKVAILYPDLGERGPTQNRAEFVLIDRLAPLTYQTEKFEDEMRKNKRFETFAENRAGVLFRRKAP